MGDLIDILRGYVDAADTYEDRAEIRGLMHEAAAEIEQLTAELTEARAFIKASSESARSLYNGVSADAEFYKWRLKAIIPLFQDARDAITAIPLHVAKLRGLDLELGNRMDAAGTATREQFDALRAGGGEGTAL